MKQYGWLGLFAFAALFCQPASVQADCNCSDRDSIVAGEYPCGNVYCQYCKTEPEYYDAYRCVWETVEVPVRKVRYNKRFVQKQCCRYVPETYYITQIIQEPEYYTENEVQYKQKWVCEQQCKYNTKFYLKPICQSRTPDYVCSDVPQEGNNESNDQTDCNG